jgi:hypothetical protein
VTFLPALLIRIGGSRSKADGALGLERRYKAALTPPMYAVEHGNINYRTGLTKVGFGRDQPNRRTYAC